MKAEENQSAIELALIPSVADFPCFTHITLIQRKREQFPKAKLRVPTQLNYYTQQRVHMHGVSPCTFSSVLMIFWNDGTLPFIAEKEEVELNH